MPLTIGWLVSLPPRFLRQAPDWRDMFRLGIAFSLALFPVSLMFAVSVAIPGLADFGPLPLILLYWLLAPIEFFWVARSPRLSRRQTWRLWLGQKISFGLGCVGPVCLCILAGMRCGMKAFPMVLMVALTGCMIVGGRCDYVDIEGVAEVVSTPQAKETEEGAYRFRFSPTHPDTERSVPGARMAGEKLRGRVFEVFDEKNRAALEGASVGDRFHVLAHVETRGTCTPLSFRIAAPIVPEQGEIRFGRDSFQLSGEARRELDRYVRAYRYLRQRGASPRFRIEGYTDGRGPREYNLIRGERMAEAVRDYLVAEGVRQEDVVVRSFGEEQPRCTTSGEEACQAQNRRVALRFGR